jgi:hypothetical protein
MLLPKNTNPAYSIYFYGAVVLNVLLNIQEEAIEFAKLFQEVNKNKKISIQAFVLSLDWLYLIGAIKVTPEGKIILLKKQDDFILTNNVIKLLKRIVVKLDDVIIAPIEKHGEMISVEVSDAEIMKNIDLLKNVFKVS